MYNLGEGVNHLVGFSQRLKLLRDKKGWSKVETARRLGLKAPSTYGNWEYGLRQPDLEMVAKIAELFGVSVDYLLGENNIPSYDLETKEKQADILYRLEKICEDIEYESGLQLGKNTLSEPAGEYILDSLAFMIKQAKKWNQIDETPKS